MKLSDSLAQNNAIHLQAEAADWRQAVRLGVDLLVAAGVVEPRYFDAILAGVERHGPYFVLAPGLAMPHGRPEEGVLKTSSGLVLMGWAANRDGTIPTQTRDSAAGLTPM
mgnify:CR=1 FL=1